jgi:hypothetical protein
MHLVYVLLPVGPPFSTGVERTYGFECFRCPRRQGTTLLLLHRTTTPCGDTGDAVWR